MLPTFAVIPTIGAGGYVTSLIDALDVQGECAGVFVIDNGCDDTVAAWLDDHHLVQRIEMHGAGIHAMWNAGIDAACAVASPCNVAVLNDDLEIGARFLRGLAAALRSGPVVAVVGPNYDSRPGTGLQPVTDICANRYDGTGGLPGFAFMVRGEDPYRFPTDLHWWYGDNDLVRTHVLAGHMVAIVLDVTCVHVDGGSKTGDWSADHMQPLLAADRVAFHRKWGAHA